MHVLIYLIFAIISLFLIYTHWHRFKVFNFEQGRDKIVIYLSKKRYNQLTPLKSRAISNQRLRLAFGIDNAFTSHEEIRVNEFVAQAKGLINLTPIAWNRLSGIAHRAVRISIENETANGHGEIKIRVMDLIQALTLRIVLHVLFSMEEETLNDLPDSRLIRLATEINTTWIASKTETTITPFENNTRLQKALLDIFTSSHDLSPQNNPQNLILPGFETMWRIVLCMFIETRYKTGLQHPEWRSQIAAFACTPSKVVFTEKVGIDNVSVEHLVNEALRLYPPTKRIYRAFQCDGSIVSKGEATDIEGSHTSPLIWGSEALSFDPRRWDRLTRTQRHAFMPFGIKPFVCPAQSVFGPRIIGLVVGALFGELGEGWTLRSFGSDGNELCSEVTLSNGRDSFDSLYLIYGGGSPAL
ncbi:Cytochrome P450 [Penicillium verhagenii]|nr:Cytochrome P450 [Penicillium verhagenii]